MKRLLDRQVTCHVCGRMIYVTAKGVLISHNRDWQGNHCLGTGQVVGRP